MKKITEKRFLLVTHYNFSEKGPVHGPTNNICNYLESKRIGYTLIANPLYSGGYIYVDEYDGKHVESKKYIKINTNNLVIKSIKEFLFLFKYLGNKKYKTSIGIDPLNSFNLSIINTVKRNIFSKLIYYCVDYADKRFENTLLNFIYHIIDRVSIRMSHSVWNVSTRIYNLRAKQGLKSNKNKLVPNSPIFIKRSQTKRNLNKLDMVIVTGVTHSKTFKILTDVLLKLRSTYSNFTATIIGTGDYLDQFKTLVKRENLVKNIFFKGQLEYIELTKELPKHLIGVALYTNDYSWTYYGDSMKVRDYFNAGLPVIMTNNVSTSDEVIKNNLGEIVALDVDDICDKISRIFDNKNYYKKLQKNVTNYAEKMSIDKILDKELNFYEKTESNRPYKS